MNEEEWRNWGKCPGALMEVEMEKVASLCSVDLSEGKDGEQAEGDVTEQTVGGAGGDGRQCADVQRQQIWRQFSVRSREIFRQVVRE